jgi:hypothetical protein
MGWVDDNWGLEGSEALSSTSNPTLSKDAEHPASCHIMHLRRVTFIFIIPIFIQLSSSSFQYFPSKDFVTWSELCEPSKATLSLLNDISRLSHSCMNPHTHLSK